MTSCTTWLSVALPDLERQGCREPGGTGLDLCNKTWSIQPSLGGASVEVSPAWRHASAASGEDTGDVDAASGRSCTFCPCLFALKAAPPPMPGLRVGWAGVCCFSSPRPVGLCPRHWISSPHKSEFSHKRVAILPKKHDPQLLSRLLSADMPPLTLLADPLEQPPVPVLSPRPRARQAGVLDGWMAIHHP